jgi:anti-sigma B factor antagonist
MCMTRLSISVTDHHTCSVITLAGELDRLSIGRLHQVLAQTITRGRVHLIAGVADLNFCDSAGLWALLQGHRCASAAGGWLRLAYAHGALKRILQVSELAGIRPAGTPLMVIMDR